jgi:VWFA-related protein
LALCSAQERPSLADSAVGTISLRRGATRKNDPPASLRVDVNRVFIPVTITDQYDRKIEGLQKGEFHLFEDGVEQPISDFFMDENPVALGVVLDSSSSMKEKFHLSKQTIVEFLHLCPAGDEYLLVTVQDKPELLQTFTSDPEQVAAVMAPVVSKGWTALYDGMYLAIHNLERAPGKERALLVVTDGGDNNSRYTEAEIREMVRESGVRVYTVSILGRSSAMEKISEESGGRAFQAHKLNELPDLTAKISALLHGEYVLGFPASGHARDGKYHTIKVQVAPPAEVTRFHASWRHGYYSQIQ